MLNSRKRRLLDPTLRVGHRGKMVEWYRRQARQRQENRKLD